LHSIVVDTLASGKRSLSRNGAAKISSQVWKDGYRPRISVTNDSTEISFKGIRLWWKIYRAEDRNAEGGPTHPGYGFWNIEEMAVFRHTLEDPVSLTSELETDKAERKIQSNQKKTTMLNVHENICVL
jgi:hypothetical protein